ncbi:hypothetical protein ACTFIV_003211 [Dictyostelium citrinum]
MLFRRCVALLDEEIDKIGRSVLQETTDASFESFLLSWDPWKQYQRRSLVPKWEELPFADRMLTSEDVCPYLQDKPERPVLYHHVVYDYDAFIQRYIEEGTDLNRENVQIDKLFRLNTSNVFSEALEENDNLISERGSKKLASQGNELFFGLRDARVLILKYHIPHSPYRFSFNALTSLDGYRILEARLFLNGAWKRKLLRDYTSLGKPTKNGQIESFNGKMKHKSSLEEWRKPDNNERPHTALKGLMPYEFAQKVQYMALNWGQGHGHKEKKSLNLNVYELMRINSSHLSQTLLSHLDENERCKIVLAEELSLLSPQDILPNQIIIQGDVEISLDNFFSFVLLNSKDVEIQGNFKCENFPFSKLGDKWGKDPSCFLPKQLKVKENMSISFPIELSYTQDKFDDYRFLKVLSDEIKVEGNLNLIRCKALTQLPENFKVNGSLNLSGCNVLTHLPEDLEIKGDLNLSYCKALTALPKGLRIWRSKKILNLSDCKALTALPKGLKVGGSLKLCDCEALTHFPEDLEIKGDLDLSYCKALTALPKGLKVGGSLKL